MSYQDLDVLESLRITPEGVIYSPTAEMSPQELLRLQQESLPWGLWRCLPWGRFLVVVPPEDTGELRLVRPGRQRLCVGCGYGNPHSLGLTFVFNTAEGSVTTYLVPDVRVQGADTWMHGGMAALLMDEIMGKTLSQHGLGGAPTARLTVQYRRPVLLNRAVRITASLRSLEGRKRLLKAEIFSDADGVLLAEAEGLFVAPRSTPTAVS